MAASRLFALIGPSFLRNSRNYARIPLKFDQLCSNPSPRFRCCSSSALSLDSDAAHDSYAVSSAHPWPEWVKFVDRLKAKGYLTQATDNNEGASVYTEMKLVKDACLNFARDRFDVFKSLSTQDIQTIVEKSCPTLFQTAVNSSKRLRAYLKRDEVKVCNSCDLRGSCDRAYITLSNAEAVAQTVDVVSTLLLYALDPIVGSGKPAGREPIESSARKLLSKLVELDDTPCDPNIPIPALSTPQSKKFSDVSDGENKRNADKKPGDWVCIKCNFSNSSMSKKCHGCGYEDPRVHMYDGEMKRGDWICPGCNFMNFAKNRRCLICKAEKPADASVDGSERKRGDWDCPRCSVLNFARNRQCFRCEEPRPQRQLRPGDWECTECDFVNFSRNTVCRKCNVDRPTPSSMLDDDDNYN